MLFRFTFQDVGYTCWTGGLRSRARAQEVLVNWQRESDIARVLDSYFEVSALLSEFLVVSRKFIPY